MQQPKGGEEREGVSLLNAFYFTAIEEMDPSLGIGFSKHITK